MQCVYVVRGSKNIIFHILYIIVAHLCPSFLKRDDFYKAHHSEKWGVLGLANYPVHSDWPNTSSMWRKCYAPYRIVMAFPGEMRLSGDIITDYNDLCCLFTRRVALRRVNITMSAFVIRETTNNKRYSTLFKTRVLFISGRNVTGYASEASDCPCKVGIAPLYRNGLCASLQGNSAHILIFALYCSGTVL